MTKLNQILAIEQGTKSRAEADRRTFDSKVSTEKLLTGISKTYRPKNEDDPTADRLPSQSVQVKVRVDDALLDLGQSLAMLLDTVATKDRTNQEARADILIEGESEPIAVGVPATHLLMLGKTLNELHNRIMSLSVLDPGEVWHYDDSLGVYATEPVESVRTKKVPMNHVLAEATVQHPAQVSVYETDIMQGTWTTVNYSGELSATRKRQLINRIEALQRAVQFARERANNTEVVELKYGNKLFEYLLQP